MKALTIKMSALVFVAQPLLAQPAASGDTSEAVPTPLRPIVPEPQRQCLDKTSSGLGFWVLKGASGTARPDKKDYVLVNYIGYLAANGVVFDQNLNQAFPVGAVVTGLSEGLLLMTKGSIWRFCVPEALAYASQSQELIPARSDLVFQVELIDFKTEAEVGAIRAQAAQGGTKVAVQASPTRDARSLQALPAPPTPEMALDTPQITSSGDAINDAKRKCAALGFVRGTPKFGQCVLKVSQ